MFNRIGKEQDSPESRAKLKVLCVDDEYVITNIMERILDEHYQVFTASSGFEGLDILKQHPDTVVIVSDQKMEGMTGNEFLMKSQEIAPEA
ncbi:MAG TPA: response regulator, partial [bacterium]|nr:response regulator [bacterium]